MKSVKTLLSAALPVCLLTACTSSGAAGTQSTPAPKPEELSPAEISETAMDNFLKKIEEGNYTIDAEEYLKTSVASRDLVSFVYADDAYRDFAVMSVNHETFQGFMDEDALRDVSFLGEGQAIEAASPRLLNYWLEEDVSDGNIYNLFYNQIEEPLTFLSREEAVKRSLMTFAGYGETALRLMEDVYLEMDDMDPKEVHLKAVVNDDMVARISYDDIDVVVTFGDAEGNAQAEAWMKDPVYPEAKTGWNDTDIFVLNSVFLPGYGEQAVPFPPFASYALQIDEENFMADDAVYIRDSHATKEDMENYAALLEKEGFTRTVITNDDGEEEVYLRMLREAFSCYSSIALEFEDGVNITAVKYYDDPVYDGLDAVNGVISRREYPLLPASDNLTQVKGTDRANALTESWLYFFTYDPNLYVDVTYDNEEEMRTYLVDYEETLKEAGYHAVMVPDTDQVDYYESEDEFCTFRYIFPEEGRATMLYKAEKYISSDEAEKMITEAGFPAIDLTEPITCRDLTRFEKVQYGKDFKRFLSFSQTYTSAQDAEAFLSAYEEKLNEAGFDRVNPAVAGSQKQIAIYNEEKGMLVGIDFFEQDGGALVNFDFSAE